MSTFPNDQRPSSRAALVRPASGMAAQRRPRAVPDLPPESTDDRRWDDRLAREIQHQEVIEASFDRAEAYGRLGDFEHALEWLDRAAVASGGLSGAYRALRARWARAAGLRARPVGRA
jgi:tetratricopeptide (TPR) repeat protein